MHLTVQRRMGIIFLALFTIVAVPAARAAGDGGKPHGATYGEWGARFWQWFMSIPAGVNPITDTTGIHQVVNQQGNVWFVGGPIGGTFTRSCTIPKGTALFVPVVNYINDYPCPDPLFQPAPGQTVEEFLREGAVGFIDLVDTAQIELDGKPLEPIRAHSGLFAFTGAADISMFDPCITGSPQIGVTDGYWVFIEPLSPGVHVLHTVFSIPAFGVFNDNTLNVTVTN